MSDFIARYAAARKAAIARDFAKLNPEQRRGVLTTEGPLQKREEKSLMRSTCFLKILLDSTASPLPGQPFFPEFCKEIKNLFYFLLTSTFVRFIMRLEQEF